MEKETDIQMMAVAVHERDMARWERTVRRLLIVILMLIVVIGVGLYEFMQYDYSEITVDSQDGSNAAYMGDGASGVINNGASGSQEESKAE